MYLSLLLLMFVNAHAIPTREIIWNDNATITNQTIQDFYSKKVLRIELPSFQIIFPGTKWCGTGNIANGDEDLGVKRETDKCCRTHDFCDDIIEAGQTRHNLTNDSFYTRLICRCDEAFYDCLKAADTMSSKEVGFLYFTVLNTKCFKYDYPIAGCEKISYFPTYRCLKYTYDLNGNKRYQYFDEPYY